MNFSEAFLSSLIRFFSASIRFLSASRASVASANSFLFCHRDAARPSARDICSFYMWLERSRRHVKAGRRDSEQNSMLYCALRFSIAAHKRSNFDGSQQCAFSFARWGDAARRAFSWGAVGDDSVHSFLVIHEEARRSSGPKYACASEPKPLPRAAAPFCLQSITWRRSIAKCRAILRRHG